MNWASDQIPALQISVEATGSLERRMTVRVPEERIAQEVESRLKSMASRVRLNGFRPGKVPFKVVQSRFGDQVRQEVRDEMIRTSFQEAVQQEELRPVSQPQVDVFPSVVGGGLGYTAVFEVYPEIQLPAVEGLTIRKPKAEVTEQDLDNMIETLRRQRAHWIPVERGAQKGDRLEIDWEMSIEGGEFQRYQEKDKPFTFVLGDNTVDFDERLIGAQAGQDLIIDHEFPRDYPHEELAGKPVQYAIHVVSVTEPQLPEVDKDFARNLGIEDGSLEELHRQLRSQMEHELEAAVQSRVKRQVTQSLYEWSAMEAPKALVESETERLMDQARQNLIARGANPEVVAKERAQYEEEARRLIAIGMILNELAKAQGIQPDPARVRSKVESIAASYERPSEVTQWYYDHPEQLGRIESLVLEDQVVEWVLERAGVEEEPSSFDELLRSGQS